MQLSATHRSKGFALLITITLLAFLVLLLVSLATLTRVETQVANNSQQRFQARQNALLALNIAIGQLQKYAGPDQRTTARSDIINTAVLPTYTPPASGRWVGVYGSWSPADYTHSPSTVSANVVNGSNYNLPTGSQAALLNWLVSGNEAVPFDPNPSASGANVGANGEITNRPNLAAYYQPTSAVVQPGSVTTSSALDATNFKVKAKDARLLVGLNTAGASAADYVVAPLVKIQVPASQTPGFSGATATTIGGYAWWVGDEGAKARINLPLAGSDPALTPAEQLAQKQNAFNNSTRAGVELIDALHPSASTTLVTGDMLNTPGSTTPLPYSPSDPQLPSLLSPSQFPMLSSSLTTEMKKAIQYRFHDLTACSTSVLSDTYAGGLKKDLSVVLAPLSATGLASPLDTDFIFQPETNVGTEVNEFGLPTWGQLRSFTQMTDTNGTGTAELTPTVPVLQKIAASTRPIMSRAGIAPILTYAGLGFRYVAPGGDVDGQQIRLAIYPIFVLWNPYTTDMKPAKYEAGIERPYYSMVQLSGQAGPVSPAVLHPWTLADVLETRDLSYGKTSQTSDPYFRFVINNTGGIPAGQSLVFTLPISASGTDYLPGSTAELTNDDYSSLSYVVLPSTGLTIGNASVPHAGGIYRVGVNRNGVRQPAGSSGPTAAVTYFPGNTSAIQSDYHWAGNGSQQTYLAPVVSTLSFAGGNTTPSPYTTTNVSRQWYQFTSWLGQTSYNYSPYGNVVGFPSDASAGTTVATGPDAGKWPALLQPEATLQPGGTPSWRMHVKSTMPSGRWLAMSNPRAFMVTNTTLTGPSNFTGSSYIVLTWPPINVFGTTNPKANSAVALYTSPAPANPTPAALYEFRSGAQPLLSIGQMQHANLGWLPSTPSYSIGNSLGPSGFDRSGASSNSATPLLPSAADSVVRRTSVYNNYANGQFTAIYDQSWLLNRALWDKYFVSTVPNKGTGTDTDTATVTATTTVPDVLPNPRHLRYNIDPAATNAAKAALLRNVDTAAAHLMLAGGFNINSTSEQAWRAVLGGTNKLSHDPTGTNVGGSAYAGPVYSHFTKPTTNATNDIWKGYRQLTEVQIAQFAQNIVTEIRRRGPIVSLADFINRRLFDNGLFDPPTGPLQNDKRLKGTLQAALDATTSGAQAINSSTTSPSFTSLVGMDYEFPSATSSYHPFTTGSAPATGSAAPTAPYSSVGAGVPQYLTQADVLSTIGSGLSARSDTFVIRTYGETVNPTDATNITSRAWCEAVVQRLPDYVDATMAPETQLSTAAVSTAKTTNQAFGRKFKIVSFRWLSPNDI